jgi:hypothetical protein
MTKKSTRRYLARVPRTIPSDRVLMHNHVIHTIDMPLGWNGFRAWTDLEPLPDFVKCPFGWSGLPHYSHREHVEATKGKCFPGTVNDLNAELLRVHEAERVSAAKGGTESHMEMSHAEMEELYNSLKSLICRAIRKDAASYIWGAVEELAKVQPSTRDDVLNTIGRNVVEHIGRECRLLAGKS